jgi:hypothetical protein
MTFAEFVASLEASGRRCWSLDHIEDRWLLVVSQYREGLGITLRTVAGQDLASVLSTGATCAMILPGENPLRTIDADVRKPLAPKRLYEDLV